MAAITPQQAHEYLNRWKLVRQIEVDQLRSEAMETKLQQLAVLMASRDLFRNDQHREKQSEELHDRWTRIRKALSG